jgi:signal peptidase
MVVNFESPTWLYLRELSSAVDRLVIFIERTHPKVADWYQEKHEEYAYFRNRQKPKISPEKLGQNLPIAFLIIYLGLVAVGALTIYTENADGIRLVSLTTGSMAPFIPPGTAVITQKTGIYHENDIITYQEINPSSGNRLPSTITHRIIKKVDAKEGYVYITKGDANKIPDPVIVKSDQIMGKVIYKIPYLGYLIKYMQSPPGFIALIVFPAFLLVYNELSFLYKQISGPNNDLSPKKNLL